MADTKKEVTTLSFAAQKRALQNRLDKKSKTKKTKKDTIKRSLSNPFALEFPRLNSDKYKEIISSLKKSLTGLNYNQYKPAKDKYRKLKKKDRITFLEKYKQDALRNPESSAFFEERASLIIGYNAVMRGLEKGKICCVFINRSTEPEIMIRMFLPLCSMNNIPLISVKSLTDIIKDPSTLGIKKCIALGLSVKAATKKSTFFTLYELCCRALHIKVLDRLPSLKEEEMKEVSPKKAIEEVNLPSAEEIKMLHLLKNRNGNKAFRPQNFSNIESDSSYFKADNDESVECSLEAKVNSGRIDTSFVESDGFLSLKMESDDSCKVNTTGKENKKGLLESKRKWQKNAGSVDISLMQSDDFFSLDTPDDLFRDDTTGKEDEKVDKKKLERLDEIEMSVKTKKRKRKSDYTPANVKKIKGNPKRRKKYNK